MYLYNIQTAKLRIARSDLTPPVYEALEIYQKIEPSKREENTNKCVHSPRRISSHCYSIKINTVVNARGPYPPL